LAGWLTGKGYWTIRPLIVAGLGILLCSMLWLGALPPTSGTGDAQAALMLRGAGLGLLSIPINLAAFSTLKGKDIAQGAAMLNLFRQLGGSFGIAVLATYLTNQTIADKVSMGRALVFGGNYPMIQRHDLATQLFVSHGFPMATANRAATDIIVRSLDAQALAVASNQCFLFIAIAIVVTAPAVLLLRPPKNPISSVPVAEAH
jgi:DHA2 family multidrug resistance protein